MMKLSFALVAFVLPLIRAQVPHWGPCPEPDVQPAFNLRQGWWYDPHTDPYVKVSLGETLNPKYLAVVKIASCIAAAVINFMGRWFEIAKLPAQFEKGQCIETNFTLTTENSIRVVSSEILNGEVRKIAGIGVIEDMKNPAKLGISYSYVLPYSPYWILSTDYVNYALVYSCTDVLRLFHVDFAWILGRTRTLPDSTIEKGRELFANNNIDVIRMIPSKQLGCDKTL